MHFPMQFIAAALAGLLFATFSPIASAETSAPPKAVLSGDLSSPWLLQLKNRDAYRNRFQQQREAAQRRAARFWGRTNQQRRGVTVPAQNRTLQRVLFQRPATVPILRSAPKPVKKQTREIDPKFLPQLVNYSGPESVGTIVIDTDQRFLYLVEGGGMARRYGVGVGREGFEWSGTNKITRKAEWPDWRPPAEMRERERKKGRELPVVMAGGPENPLGARALYLGSTLYRIHGTNQPWTIGQAMSSGCIRMRNEDVMDLYERVSIGNKVIVR